MILSTASSVRKASSTRNRRARKAAPAMRAGPQPKRAWEYLEAFSAGRCRRCTSPMRMAAPRIFPRMPAVVARGKIVFAENCARCHSSKRPPQDYQAIRRTGIARQSWRTISWPTTFSPTMSAIRFRKSEPTVNAPWPAMRPKAIFSRSSLPTLTRNSRTCTSTT